jgi:hypothetical protein
VERPAAAVVFTATTCLPVSASGLRQGHAAVPPSRARDPVATMPRTGSLDRTFAVDPPDTWLGGPAARVGRSLTLLTKLLVGYALARLSAFKVDCSEDPCSARRRSHKAIDPRRHSRHCRAGRPVGLAEAHSGTLLKTTSTSDDRHLACDPSSLALVAQVGRGQRSGPMISLRPTRTGRALRSLLRGGLAVPGWRARAAALESARLRSWTLVAP